MCYSGAGGLGSLLGLGVKALTTHHSILSAAISNIGMPMLKWDSNVDVRLDADGVSSLFLQLKMADYYHKQAADITQNSIHRGNRSATFQDPSALMV